MARHEPQKHAPLLVFLHYPHRALPVLCFVFVTCGLPRQLYRISYRPGRMAVRAHLLFWSDTYFEYDSRRRSHFMSCLALPILAKNRISVGKEQCWRQVQRRKEQRTRFLCHFVMGHILGHYMRILHSVPRHLFPLFSHEINALPSSLHSSHCLASMQNK